MKPLVSLIAAAIALAALPIAAQWPNYSVAGAPRTPEGKVNSGRSGAQSSGRPSGSFWNLGSSRSRWSRWTGRPAKGPPPQKGAPPPELPPGTPPNATFKNVGSGFKEGLPMLPWAADLVKQRRAENSKDNPDAHCLPLGLMQLHMHPQPRKIIQTPGSDRHAVRSAGRHPADLHRWPAAAERCRALVVRLLGRTSGTATRWWWKPPVSATTCGWISTAVPLTESGKMTERIRRLNYGTLQIDMTIEDPKAYTKPFTVRVTHRLLPDTDLIEFICTENDRSGPHLVGK